MITVYILCDDVGFMDVYKTRQEALKDALKKDLKDWFINERVLKLQ